MTNPEAPDLGLRQGRSWVWVLVAAATLTSLATLAADVALGHDFEYMLRSYTITNLATGLLFAPIAGLILTRHPRHRVGRMMMWIGLVAPLQVLTGKVAMLATGPATTIGEAPGWVTVLWWIPQWMWVPAIIPILLLLPLFFPDDRLPSPRWRPFVWLCLAVTGLMTLGFAIGLAPWATDTSRVLITSDFQAEGWPVPAVGAVIEPMFGLVLVLGVISLGSTWLRYRRADGLQRQQLRWLLLAVLVVVPGMTGLLVVQALDFTSIPLWVFVGLTIVALPVPVAIGIAILRHQLFDIDLVLSRSIVYAGLAGFITTVYIGLVVGVGNLVGGREDPSLLLQVVATAFVAVLFQPVRRGLQLWANRLVFGQRSTPYQVLSSFASQAARTPDESTLQEVARLLAAGTGSQPARVWLRVAARLVPVASAPSDEKAAPLEVEGETLPDMGSDLAVPVVHDGELLGALTLTKTRGEQMTPQDIDLADRLATGVAMMLRNLRLTAELRERLEQLTRSRQRLVTAQDDARRRMEQDIHDGAQQQLVSLRIKLGAARQLAERSEAEKTTLILRQLAADADGAIETLRELARGIYPPLLEAEGLAAAIESQAAKSPLPISVHAAGVGRYEPHAEVAVYFSVLEALNNVAKYAQATSAHVRLDETDSRLRFVVEDDGVGFDPAKVNGGSGLPGMADRLDTLGGGLEVTSRVGHGTIVAGSVPVTQVLP